MKAAVSEAPSWLLALAMLAAASLGGALFAAIDCLIEAARGRQR